MSSLDLRQNDDNATLYARAMGCRYARAKQWRGLRIYVAIGMGLAGPLVGLLAENASPYLGAAAGLWALVGRGLAMVERHYRRQGQQAQECFDTHVFELPWNSALARRPSREDLIDWASTNQTKSVDWYPPEVARLPRPLDALLCQRASANWARRDHERYRVLVAGVGVVMLVISVIIGVLAGMSLGEYLIKLALPLLPALLEIIEIADQNAQLAVAKSNIETRIDELIATAAATGQVPSEQSSRAAQDELFATRGVAAVPEWWYSRTRDRREAAMVEAAEACTESLLAALPEGSTAPMPEPLR